MRFLAFCDYGDNIGLGHLRRCEKILTLLKSVAHIQYDIIKNATLQDIKALKGKHFSGIIVDSYVFTRTHYDMLSALNAPLLCFDDENRCVYPAGSFVLNGAPNAQELYPHIKTSQNGSPNPHIVESNGVHYLLGLHYALTSADFMPKPTHKEQIYDIFINFGGADSLNLSAQVLKYIPQNSHAHLVLGELYAHTIKPKNNVTLYHNLSPRELGALLVRCDIAISAGGGMLLELAQSQMPSIVFASAPNQRFQVAQFANLGAFIEAKSLSQIPALIQSLSPKSSRKDKADILARLSLGVHLLPALKEIFKF